ncbi:MAG: bifunctional [glutamine synthetase] adenylyltransferase/[glutamine synthetase]-adenylyl-L-tyrosine phosphorylase [Proteobacteria bacterium]|nr:bifunctional [glutamine synthetase] adenylyltransferase/[glutamine synthetase]-adenylyl-L-tyrosine phosphorylase [Pseudomonadota bacterium]
MHDFTFLNTKCALPEPASAEKAALGLERWLEAAETAGLTDFAEQSATDPLARKTLTAIFGNSPFLTDSILRDPGFTHKLLTMDPAKTFEAIIEGLNQHHPARLDDEALSRLLRVAKREMALTVALADIAGLWPLEKITGALSDFAETALSLTAAHVLREAAAQGAFSLTNPENPEQDSGLVILAMGKLGGRELNYSSDIDLIVLYDPVKIDTQDPGGLQNHFVRLTKKLVRLMDERTTDGYVFRTDLRLRPDPGVTPIALSVMAAETYYETLGQNWERAAMIKARPVAGDIDAGHAFLKQLTPYVWRKNLDFAAIQDIHSIKRQIHAHRGGATIAVAGHNIKLGRGGIREIEFFAQTQQLIWGGRDATLRSSMTTETLTALVASGHCKRDVADELISAYEFLRRLEHRLQMVNDEQTQSLPDDPIELEKIAVFMGYPGTADFADDLTRHLNAVQTHYGELFDNAPSLGADDALTDAGNLVFTGGDPDPETLTTIRGLGYGNPKIVDQTVRGWHHGRYRATRSTRAREILTELMPVLLKAIGSTSAPDVVFLRFDNFLSRLPSGVQLFSMFHANPQLLDLVAEILGKAPRLAEHLSNRPAVLDSVLTQDFFDPPPARKALQEELNGLLGRTDNLEQKLDISRRWNHDRRFQIGVQCLRGAIQPGDAGLAFSNIAEAALSGLYPVVEDEFVRQHGRIPGAGMAVLALGKLGSREMSASSDLDLVFIYATPEGDSQPSDGERPLDSLRYFARLSQRLINALTALTSEGLLYEVDMRLRPSGAKGPIASTLEGFIQYHNDAAWTWERMALTRARALLGPDDLCQRITETIRAILSAPRDEDDLLRDVAAMRQRLDDENHTECIWALKHLRGGLVDIEFITQYLTLKYAHAHPKILGLGTRGTLSALMEAKLLDADNGRSLTDALDLWQGLQGLLSLTIDGEITSKREEEISSALKKDLVMVAGGDPFQPADFAALRKSIEARTETVYGLFKNLIEDPAAALPPPKTEPKFKDASE